MTALENAIQVAGSARKLGVAIGVTGMAISRWKTKYAGIVPASRVLQIYEVTGVTPHELRPDLYPNPSDGLPQKDPQLCKLSHTEMIATANQKH